MIATTLLPAAFALAALLALGFHRQRAALVLLLAGLFAAGMGSGQPRLAEAALRFVPPLLLFVVALPETGLLARRQLLLIGTIGVLAALALGAPAHVHAGLLRAAGWLALGQAAPQGAAVLCTAAGLLSLLRWVLRGAPIDLGLALVCVALAVAAAPQWPELRLAALVAACALGILAVLAASYRMAFVDPLSGLPNRRALDEALARLSGDYALAMVDIDHFKGFNDSHGHDAGDVVLAAVGRLLRRHAGGRAYRYGGEEFCVVYTGRAAASAAACCERAREVLAGTDIRLPPLPAAARARGKSRPQTVRVTASFGVARRTPDRRVPAEVLKAADQALYRAKAKGRNRVVGP